MNKMKFNFGQHWILDTLAMKILNKEFGEGDSMEVDVERTISCSGS